MDQRATDCYREQPDEGEPLEPPVVEQHGQVCQEGIASANQNMGSGRSRPARVQPAARRRSAWSVNDRSDANAALTAASSERSSTP